MHPSRDPAGQDHGEGLRARHPRLRVPVRAAPPRCGTPLRASVRLFTAEVRTVTAGAESSFLSLAFIYTLIKELHSDGNWQRVAAARGPRPGSPPGGAGTHRARDKGSRTSAFPPP